MDLILDFGFAWISVILVVLLSIIYILRKLMNKNKNGGILKSLNRSLRKHHKILGIALILTGLVHGLSSSVSVLSFNLGTLCWIMSILLGLNYMLHSYFHNKKGWIYYHRILTAAFIAVLALHIYNVGIQAPGLLRDAIVQNKSGSNEDITDSTDLSDHNSSSVSDNTAAGNNSASSDTAGSGSSSDSSSGSSTSSNTDASAGSNSSEDSISKQMEGLELKDGTYEGTANGFGGELTVSVVIKDNAIESIDIVSHNERNSRIYSRAMDQVPQEIIDNQSLDVDTVSGATFTSTGIINAAKNALSKALISGTLPEDLALPSNRGH